MEKVNRVNILFKKYFSIFKFSLKMNITFIYDYIFSIISYTIHIFVFNELWDFILKDGSLFGYEKQELIWYIIITEYITFSVTSFYKKISEMVKSGMIANMLTKPMNFILYVLSEESANMLKIIINAFAAIILGKMFGGTLIVSSDAILFFVISIIFAFIIAMIIQLIIGLIAFYIEETKSIWFIIQKAQFLLVFVPIEFYGGMVQKLLMLLPTTHMIYTPATILLKYDFENCIALLSMQIINIIVLMFVTCILYKKGVRRINVNGG
ncbi:MAG: ABC-2 family transporter protein [Clostridia bacterium]|nr:ABC-2 family transporter protein [Clostridia bacterium]